MRKLTVKRNKSFVGCLVKLKVYIEDEQNSEITISGTPCRKIGELKNGEEKTFEIDNAAHKVFAIADKVSKDYCNDFYEIPEGDEDVSVSGNPKLNPSTGNAFVFDNNQSSASAANRKKNSKKGIIVLIVAVIIGAIAGVLLYSVLSNGPAKEKDFKAEEMTITLTDKFTKRNLGNYTASFSSKKASVFVLKEDFSLLEGFGELTLDEYADLVAKNNKEAGREIDDIKKEDGIASFTYKSFVEEGNKTYVYDTYMYKSDSAFWIVQIVTLEEDAIEMHPDVIKWAKSVRFN